MAYVWNNVGADRDGTAATNWTPNTPAGGPEAGSDITYDGNEAGLTPLDGDQLPTTMPSVALDTILISAAYTLSAGAAGDFTDFTGGNASCTWDLFSITGVTLQTPGTPTIISGGILGVQTDGILDTANPIETGGTCYIDWNYGGLEIFGGINASHAISHVHTTDSILICDVTGPLNLGATADTGLAIDINAPAGAVTLGADIYCGDFTMTAAATFNGNGFEVIASGNVLGTAVGTLTNFLLDMRGTTKTLAWPVMSDRISMLTLSNGATIATAAGVETNAVATEAGTTLTLTGANILTALPTGNDFLDIQGELAGTGTLRIRPYGDVNRTNVGRCACVNLLVLGGGNANGTWTQSGNMVVTGNLQIYNDSTGFLNTLTLTGGASLTGDPNILLGISSSSVDRSGVINCGTGVLAVGAITTGSAAPSANAFTMGSASVMFLSGNANFNNIKLGSSDVINPIIYCTGTGEVTNTEDKDVDFPIAVFGDATSVGANNHTNITDYGPNKQTQPWSLASMGGGGGHAAVSS